MGKLQRKKKMVNKKVSGDKQRYSIEKDPARLRVVACLMVKDEQEDIERCLNALSGYVDDIYILDTGSSDKTPVICESMGCIVNYLEDVKSYFVETEFGPMLNFSKARNKSLSYVQGDWLISIDADEEFIWDNITPEMFKKYLASQSKKITAVNVKLNDIQRNGPAMIMTVAKIFRVGHVHYENIVHNRAVSDGMGNILPGPVINHYGYDAEINPEKQKKKRERTLGLLKVRVEKNPSDFEAWFYLGQQYILGGDIELGIEACARYVSFKKLAKSKRHFNSTVYYSAAKTLIDRGRFNEASNWIKEGLEDDPKDMDLSYALLCFGVGTQKNDLVLKGAEQYLACYDRFSKDPRFNYGKFNLTFNPALLCNALHALALARIRAGVETIVQLDRQMLQIDETKRSNIYQGLMLDLQNAGIGQLVKVMSADKIVEQNAI